MNVNLLGILMSSWIGVCSFLLVYRDYGYLKLHVVILVVIGATNQ